jgi:hypothetical protein
VRSEASRLCDEASTNVSACSLIIAGGALLTFNPMLAALVAEVKLEIVRELADGEEPPEGKRKVDIE